MCKLYKTNIKYTHHTHTHKTEEEKNRKQKKRKMHCKHKKNDSIFR